jgi:MFS family permease
MMSRSKEAKDRVRITAGQRRRSMRFAVVGAIHALIGYTCLGEKVLSLVALKLGAGEFILGVLSFIMVGTWAFRVFMMNAIERYGKKRVLIFWKSVSAACIIPFLFLPLIAERWPMRVCLGFLLGTAFIRSATYALGNAGWFPLLQDIVPRRFTGRFFANVRVSWQPARVLSLLAVAWFLGKEPAWWKFGVVFSVGLVAYAVRTAMIIPMAESVRIEKEYEGASIWKRFSEAFGDVKIRHLIFYMTSFLVAALVAEPFKIKYLKDLGYSDGFILAGTAMIGVGAIVSLRFWGRLADSYGNIPVFNISHVGLPIVNFLWIFVGSESEVFVFVLFFVWSIFFAGNGIAMTRYTLHVVPYDNQNQMNIVFVIANFFAGLAPVVAGLFLEWTRGFGAGYRDVSINNYHVFFFVSTLLYVFPIVLRKRLVGVKDSTTIEVVATVLRPVTNMFGPFLHVGSKSEPKDRNDSKNS